MLKGYQMFCAIWYRLYTLKNVKNTHRGMSPLVKLHAYVIHGNIRSNANSDFLL